MVFSSLSFMTAFLPLTILLYFVSGSSKWRNGVLLVFSLIFYSWGEPKRILIMLASILINYMSALAIASSSKRGVKRMFLVLGLAVTLGGLLYFKYFAFFVNSINGLFGFERSLQPLSLPIGISFYTFQIITYTVDVYLGKTPVQRNLPRLMLYISFFPQLIAGPIVNYTQIMPYLAERKSTLADIYGGMRRFIIGLAKKVLLANVCGEIVAGLELFGNMSALEAWLGAIAYTLQIYFDFSGYSDMAIGMGRIFGFKFLENFRYPYLSSSVTEFWRRWHISLGSFFREYVYIPMGGNRVKPFRQALNLIIVWGLTGLWHGASWNFIVWGLYFGLLLIFEKLFMHRVKIKWPKVFGWAITMLLVVFSWVIFYHENLSDGLRQLSAMLVFGADGMSDPVSVYYLKRYIGAIVISCIACVPWREISEKLSCKTKELSHKQSCTCSAVLVAGESVVLTALFLMSAAFVVSSSYNPFLYFRF